MGLIMPMLHKVVNTVLGTYILRVQSMMVIISITVTILSTISHKFLVTKLEAVCLSLSQFGLIFSHTTWTLAYKTEFSWSSKNLGLIVGPWPLLTWPGIISTPRGAFWTSRDFQSLFLVPLYTLFSCSPKLWFLAVREGTGLLQGQELNLSPAQVASDWDGSLSLLFQREGEHDIQKWSNPFLHIEVPQGAPSLQCCVW